MELKPGQKVRCSGHICRRKDFFEVDKENTLWLHRKSGVNESMEALPKDKAHILKKFVFIPQAEEGVFEKVITLDTRQTAELSPLGWVLHEDKPHEFAMIRLQGKIKRVAPIEEVEGNYEE